MKSIKSMVILSALSSIVSLAYASTLPYCHGEREGTCDSYTTKSECKSHYGKTRPEKKHPHPQYTNCRWYQHSPGVKAGCDNDHNRHGNTRHCRLPDDTNTATAEE